VYLVRRELIDKIVTDLVMINKTNGYNNTILENNIEIGIKPASTIKSFPHIGIEMGTEKQVSTDESGTLIKRNADVIIIISINSSDVSIIETYIEDIKAFFTVGNSDILPTIDLSTIKYLTGYMVDEVTPIIDRVKNYSMVGILIKVEYLDVIDDYTLTRLVSEDDKIIISEN
jgi:hypothetical protein